MTRLLAAAAALAALAGCARQKPLPVYGRVPEFTLTAQTGLPFSSSALKGKVWVADFIFTTCMGPCPRMTSQMHWVEQQVAGLPDVRLVSFTVDPAHDTPPVLADYAGRFHADPARWHFLTGPQPALDQLDRYAFKLGNVDGALTHSTRFVLVDARSQIRGYYGTDEQDGLKPLIADIARLARESDGRP
jgi:protein SCO1/2